MPRQPLDPGAVRKVIVIDGETWVALRLLAKDTMADFQELVDEAFADLLAKHKHPASLRDALRASGAEEPASERTRKAAKPRGSKQEA